MSDWSSYVRRNLRLPTLRPEREAEIVEDLARQLDDAYREALSSGLAEAEARARGATHHGLGRVAAGAIGNAARQLNQS
jgi:hypothetical protein